MNERIRELVEQATIPFKDENGFECYHFSKEKFAELIVRDCCDFIEAGHHSMVDRLSLSTYIKKHFGVAE